MTHRAAVIGAGPPASTPPTSCSRRAGRSTSTTRCRPRSASCARASRPTTRSSSRSRASTRRPRPSRASASSAASSSARRHPRGAARALPRGRLRGRHRPTTTGSGSPGEDRPGSHSATEFVAWYNGHPDYRGHRVRPLGRARGGDRQRQRGDRRRPHARARPDELAPTDTADHAIEHFGRSTVDEVILLGRRGPAQAAFTNPEVRELGELLRADVICDPRRSSDEATEPGTPTAASATSSCSATTRARAARASRTGSSCASCARRSRSSARARTARHRVRVSVNRLEDGRAVPDRRGGGHRVRARAPLDRLPRPPARRHPVGRRARPDLQRRRPRRRAAGEYFVGWIKRGPSA